MDTIDSAFISNIVNKNGFFEIIVIPIAIRNDYRRKMYCPYIDYFNISYMVNTTLF